MIFEAIIKNSNRIPLYMQILFNDCFLKWMANSVKKDIGSSLPFMINF